MKKIILAGGGTAGHVMPNLAIAPLLRAEGFEIHYIGGRGGMEKNLVEAAGIPFYGISTGKLRRDRLLSVANFKDMFGAVAGVRDAMRVIKEIKPVCVFSKGGFVGLPVAIACKLRGTNLILHESDLSSGLANRLSIGFARAVCASFPETMEGLPVKKAVLTGNPIRAELLTGNAKKGREYCGFDGSKPIILFMGGSSGSELLNNALKDSLPVLLDKYHIVHLTGKGKLHETMKQHGYAAFEFIDNELPNVLSASDIIVSRAGANALNEFLALRKPSLLIPLARATRGDQIENARSFASRGFSMLLEEKHLTAETLAGNVDKLYNSRDKFISNMEKSDTKNAAAEVVKTICAMSKEQ